MQGKTGDELAEEIKENGSKKHARYVLLLLVITADVSVLRPKRVKRMNFRRELYEL